MSLFSIHWYCRHIQLGIYSNCGISFRSFVAHLPGKQEEVNALADLLPLINTRDVSNVFISHMRTSP
jgi:hypothetical protein